MASEHPIGYGVDGNPKQRVHLAMPINDDARCVDAHIEREREDHRMNNALESRVINMYYG